MGADLRWMSLSYDRSSASDAIVLNRMMDNKLAQAVVDSDIVTSMKNYPSDMCMKKIKIIELRTS